MIKVYLVENETHARKKQVEILLYMQLQNLKTMQWVGHTSLDSKMSGSTLTPHFSMG